MMGKRVMCNTEPSASTDPRGPQRPLYQECGRWKSVIEGIWRRLLNTRSDWRNPGLRRRQPLGE